MGHGFSFKKEDVRAFVLSAELFTPNVQKHGLHTSINKPVAVDVEKMRRVIEFILAKRTKNDLVLMFDGRSKACRHVIEEFEERFAASGAHAGVECVCFCIRSQTRWTIRVFQGGC